jgi:phosphate starvation-inducible PhoH-like protein
VHIAHRHEQFKIDGPKDAVNQAMEVLQAAYEAANRSFDARMLQLILASDPSMMNTENTLHTRKPHLTARTQNQAVYLEQIAENDITLAIGPAGTGKTYLAVASAVDALERSNVQRIVLTRPAVEAGERLGFLPGDMHQKIDPYLRPLYDALYDLMGFEKVTKAFERGALEVAPLAFMRGRTLNNAFVILDEAQNTTPEQMKMFLTRLGFGSKAVVTGDVSQIDLPKDQRSGLVEVETILKNVTGIGLCYLNSTDVVRHPLVARIVDAYDHAAQKVIRPKAPTASINKTAVKTPTKTASKTASKKPSLAETPVKTSRTSTAQKSSKASQATSGQSKSIAQSTKKTSVSSKAKTAATSIRKKK